VLPQIFDDLSFDPFTMLKNNLCAADIGIAGRNDSQAFVPALLVAMLDERLEVAEQ
jgi:hypothetical protein